MKRSEHSPGVIVAVKEIKEYKSEQETSDFQHEMSVMKDMIHPNIIHLYGMIKEGQKREVNTCILMAFECNNLIAIYLTAVMLNIVLNYYDGVSALIPLTKLKEEN